MRERERRRERPDVNNEPTRSFRSGSRDAGRPRAVFRFPDLVRLIELDADDVCISRNARVLLYRTRRVARRLRARVENLTIVQTKNRIQYVLISYNNDKYGDFTH